MKKINVFYLILVILAVLMSAVVLFRDMKDASLKEKTVVEKVIQKVDTVYITQTIHDTIYVEKSSMTEKSPVEKFTDQIRQVLTEELGPFYQEYIKLTEENIEEGKVRFEQCERNAKKRYDALVTDFLKEYPEELDYINNLVSKELTKAIKPYLHMLNEYGNRQQK